MQFDHYESCGVCHSHPCMCVERESNPEMWHELATTLQTRVAQLEAEHRVCGSLTRITSWTY